MSKYSMTSTLQGLVYLQVFCKKIKDAPKPEEILV
ncbi:hypothetical protein R3I93_013577 [Phoxinus phoxinus]|uniref:Uncharacterized protein n=1 Tax=Phoxinus phoxinus TaxID=58324 RepID=A0AAN9CSM0_9TELE